MTVPAVQSIAMTPLQRRHRTWIAATVAAGILGAAGSQAWAPAIGVLGIVLIYAAGISGNRPGRFAVPGALLLAAGIWQLAARPPATMPWPIGLASAMLLLAASARVLAHFVRVPDRAVQVAAVACSLLAGLVALLLAVSAPVTQPVVLPGWALLAAGLVGTERLWRRWMCSAGRRRAKLSIMIISFNEADRIEECLQRLAGWADEIVVVDSGSTDATVEIARRYTDQVLHADWSGFGRQKQFALEQCSGDWILNLDADEYIDEPLQHEIDAWLSTDPPYRAFRICWVSMVFGKPVFFGADGRYHKRLFRREGTRFNEADVHEDIVVDGPVARLGSPVIHDTFRDYAHLKSKFTRYALISAERIRTRSSTTGPVTAWLRGLSAFLLLYIRRLGVLDGRRGLLMATAYATYTFDKYAAAWSRQC